MRRHISIRMHQVLNLQATESKASRMFKSIRLITNPNKDQIESFENEIDHWRGASGAMAWAAISDIRFGDGEGIMAIDSSTGELVGILAYELVPYRKWKRDMKYSKIIKRVFTLFRFDTKIVDEFIEHMEAYDEVCLVKYIASIKRGTGTKLMMELISILKSENIPLFGYADRTSVGFYEKLGGLVIDGTTWYYALPDDFKYRMD